MPLYHNFHHGTTTDDPLASVVETIHSDEFADLPVVAAPDTILLTLDPLGTGGDPEIVEVTGHVALSDAVTVTRAEQTTLNGGAAREHPAGTEWRWAWTAGDAVATVSTTGDTMTGPLVLSGDPTLDTHAANKNYVDDRDALYLPLAGGTVTGQIAGISPTLGAHLTRKDYVDAQDVAYYNAAVTYAATQDGARVAVAGDTMTGNLNFGASVASGTGAAIRDDGAIQSTYFADDSAHTVLSANVSLVRAKTPVSDPGGVFILLRRSGGGVASQSTVGSITIDTASSVNYNETSDYRIKDDLGPIDDPLDVITRLQPKHLRWKEDGVEFDGFIAHEVAEVVPHAVTGEKDAMSVDGKMNLQQLDTGKLIPYLVAAIQVLAARVTELEAG